MTRESVAIIGIGCRFPGADTPAAFWELLREGHDAITDMPPERVDIDLFLDSGLGIAPATYRRRGGYLRRIDDFDPGFFGISPREASTMDPQQRLLLEVAWEALEDGGQTLEGLDHRGGVFVGMWINDFDDLLALEPENLDLYAVTGGSRFSASGRLSYSLGLEGPSLTVDTACSSALTAVHLACQSLREQECDLALAGGVNLILQPQGTLGFAHANLLAADGRCKFGDRRADGFSRSEGVGIVALKLLDAALADRDPIYAVIRGSAVNNNGQSSGQMVTPGSVTQSAVLREACRTAGISPADLDYVEAHGTGTPVGDPIELKALGAVVTEGGRPADQPCLVGSVKTNIGHTEGASGVAGLIKLALSLRNGQIPPSLFPVEPNPAVPWSELPLEIVRELRAWPSNGAPRRAGLNSFGLSGTNAHVVVEEAPEPTAAVPEAPPRSGAVLVPLSARSPEALEQIAGAVGALARPDGPEPWDLGFTAAVRRTHHDHRLALLVRDRADLAAKIAAFGNGERLPGMSHGKCQADSPPRVVFVFPGQGSQWIGMGRELLAREPVFRRALEACAAAIRQHADWSLLDELGADAAASRLDRIDVVQPTLWALQIALAELWRSWGVEPLAVVGQSMGEVAAAYVAGALSLADSARIICRRSRLLRRASGEGEMAMVELDFEATREALAGREEHLSIAVAASFRSTVVSGDPAALVEVLAELEARGVFCRRIKVDVASHSPQMDPLRPDLLAALEGLVPRATDVPFYSTVEANFLEGTRLDPAYWVRNLRQPVRFTAAIEELSSEGVVFLEVSPHPVLLPAIEQGLHHLGHEGVVLASLRRDEGEREMLYHSLGALYRLGQTVDWRRLYAAGGRFVTLPTYPWQRQRFWPGAEDTDAARRRKAVVRPGHPLLGPRLFCSTEPGLFLWETEVGPDVFPYLADHRLRGQPVMPAAAYLEMVLAGAGETFGQASHEIEAVDLKEALIWTDAGHVRLQLVMRIDMPGLVSFKISSTRPAEDDPGSWILHAEGSLRLGDPEAPDSPARSVPLAAIRARSGAPIPAPEIYEQLRGHGLEYGAGFKGMVEVWRHEGEALARLERTPPVSSGAGVYKVHPALLDACFQALLAARGEQDGADLHLPVAIDSLRLHDRAPSAGELWSHAVIASTAGGELSGDVTLLDAAGQALLEVRKMCLRRLPATGDDRADWFFSIRWQEAERPEATREIDHWWIFADRGGLAAAAARDLREHGAGTTLVEHGDSYAAPADGHAAIRPGRREDFERWLREIRATGDPSRQGIVYLWALDAPTLDMRAPTRRAEEADLLTCDSVVHLLQALAAEGCAPAGLWLVTRESRQVDGDDPVAIVQAPLWGLGGVLAQEHPAWGCIRLDLEAALPARELCAELRADSAEDQVVLRASGRYVARLAHWRPPAAPSETTVRAAGDEPYRLEIATPGLLDQLALRGAARPEPGPGEVEIEVLAAGLNFHDIVMAMGLLSAPAAEGSLPLGVECAGRIAALGQGVAGFAIGDPVMGFARHAIARYALTDHRLLCRKPDALGFEQAAGTSAVFVTAYYALHYLGRLRRGERVLIHSASGGVGLAALQIARWLGAEVLATAGSPEKRKLLADLGVRHVMDSRSLKFAAEVLELTDGRGVDVVLNALTGEAVAKNLSILAPYGRFLEIGKRDLYEDRALRLRPFLKNLSYFAIDIKELSRDRPELFAELLGEVLGHFEAGTFEPLPSRTFPVTAAAEAFRFMAQARHTGKIVLELDHREVSVLRPGRTAELRADATYLITGGLGGLGLSFARWMVEHGARHLVLVGRSGASAAARTRLRELEEAGAEVVVARADVARADELAAVLSVARAGLPPLAGVVHAAGLLDDSTLLELDRERFQKVMEPKADGAWNLHRLTLDDTLDFFVLFSSVATLLHTQGQGNYAAANAFLDALAAARRTWGLPATSIAWGPWSDVGLAAARANRGERLAHHGLASFTPAAGLAAYERILEHDPAHVAVMPFDAATWRRSSPAAASSPFFDLVDRSGDDGETATASASSPAALREALLAQPPGRARREMIFSHVAQQLAQVLRLPVSQIDHDKPLRAQGLDSLMALELRNRLESSLGLTLAVTAIWNHPTVTALVSHMAREMGMALDAEPEEAAAAVSQDAAEGNDTTSRNRADSHGRAGNRPLRTAADFEDLTEEEALAELVQGR